MFKSKKKLAQDDSAHGSLTAVVTDVEAAKEQDGVVFPLAPLGAKPESITQSHIGKGRKRGQGGFER